MKQVTIDSFVLGTTRAGDKPACYMYVAGLKFYEAVAYEEQFPMLPFSLQGIAPTVGSPERQLAINTGLLRTLPSPVVIAVNDKKKIEAVVGGSGQAAPSQPAYQQPATQPAYQNGGQLSQQSAPAQPQRVWYPYNESDWELNEAITEQAVKMRKLVQDKVDEVFTPEEWPQELRKDIATNVAIGLEKKLDSYRGYALGKVSAPPDPRDGELILRADKNSWPQSYLDAVASLHPHINHGQHTKNILAIFGHKSVSANDPEAQVSLAHQAWDYADLRQGGMEEDAAKAAVVKKYGLPGDWL